ncbi:MAG: tetraacyldisaccharide 4'-kinase [Pseudomonadota bacterium]
MKTPSFWYQTHLTWQAILLLPASIIYTFILRIRYVLYHTHSPLPVPVIAVGNITAGGNGKTPTALALLSFIQNIDPQKKVFFLSRGTGAAQRGPICVNPQGTAKEFGDEPLLLARHASTIIARDRRAGAMLAIRQGADIIIMDDGLQNRSIAPDARLILSDATRGFGNGLLLPAGPLRQSVRSAMRQADAVIIVGSGPAPLPQNGIPSHIPIIQGERVAVGPLPDPSRTYHAFAGLANPNQFFDSLRTMGLTVVRTTAFPDHHAYTPADIAHLRQGAGDATLITTEKDRVKLPPNMDVTTVSIQMRLTPLSPLLDILRQKCGLA